MIGDSHSPEFLERVRDELDGELVDFLFVDGDHSEAGVSQDYEFYGPLVRPDGLIAFHDIVDDQPLPTNQVQRFWKKLSSGQDTKEFIDNRDQCGFGIGVLRVPQTGAS